MNTKQGNKKQFAGKNKKLESFFLFLLLFFFTFIGCQEPFDPGNILFDIPEGKGSFSLTLSNASRTVLPATPNLNDFVVYNLNFTPMINGSAESVDRTNGTLAAYPFYLNPGTYRLVVNAYKDNNKTRLAAQGTLDGIVITAGGTASANVTLEALFSEGTGTFRWNITFPAGVTASMTITPANGETVQTVTLTSPTASGNRTLNSGQYNLTFNLKKTDGKSVVWKELLHVYQNLESNFTFTFTDDHFSGAYTVTYNYNDGITSNQTQSVLHGAALTRLADPTRGFYTFSGWYADNGTFASLWNFNNTVIEPFTLYAKWDIVPLEAVTGLANKLAWLQVHAQSNESYVLEVSANESIGPHTLSYSGRSNIGITLIGAGGGSYRTVNLSSNGAMFTVDSGITLILDNNITLQGRSGNNNSLVRVNSGGILTMNTGSTITGNTSASSNANSYGGGVYVDSGTFTMNGGTISNNGASSSASSNANSYGGGVYVNSGTFTMNGGTISNNGASSSASNGYAYGEGVYVGSNGTFEMSNGTISNNYAYNCSTYGVAVCVDGTFTMSGGNISNNQASSGNFYTFGIVNVSGTFTMIAGKISGNTITTSTNQNTGGGGVYVRPTGIFTMEGGEISGNTVSHSSNGYISGGGVYVQGQGRFVMNSGTINGNKVSGSSSSLGGGVFGAFTMNGGKIYGNTASLGGGVYGSPLTMNEGEIYDNTASMYGGGVYYSLTMNGGKIYGNTASYLGGGVYGTGSMYSGEITGNAAGSSSSSNVGGGMYVYSGASSRGTFTMIGGKISDNVGGGVYVRDIFIMEGGTISGNTARVGGGVFVEGEYEGSSTLYKGTFTMIDGEISGNSAPDCGGGVYVQSYGTFNKTGGIITGYASDTDNGNVIKNGTVNDKGHAVYVLINNGSVKRMENTVGPEADLSFNGTTNPPTWSGDWDY